MLIDGLKVMRRDLLERLSSFLLRTKLCANSVRAERGISVSGLLDYRIGAKSYIRRDARLHGKSTGSLQPGRINIGKKVQIGESCELGTQSGAHMVIADHATVNDRCKLFGDIRIGSFALLSADICISSFNHTIDYHPYQLVKDQDKAITFDAEAMTRSSLPVVIEEDAWIGYGVFVKPGVYVGKGAIIGAGAVLTRDVLPYEIHVGIPNRQQDARLEFHPPNKVIAMEESHSPYFYRGFGISQKERKHAAPRLGLFAASKAFCLLKHTSEPTKLEIVASAGIRFARNQRVAVLVSGVPVGHMDLTKRMSNFVFEVNSKYHATQQNFADPIYRLKDLYTIVEFQHADSDENCRDAFVIGSVSQKCSASN